MKRIVICCDGTWNTPGESDAGVPVPTNVVRLFNAVAEVDAQGTEQLKYYHPGVGTDGSWWDKLSGGSTGRGLDRNIMSAYRYLCDHYSPDDAIFLFGFSRGAYTVRSLGGLIAHCGLLRTADLTHAEAWRRIEQVFEQGYRRGSEKREHWESRGWAFHNRLGTVVNIRFLGVWDTVGALGIPNDMAVLKLLDSLHDYTFHDTVLGESVETARHAVALDEIRASFQPTLWSAKDGADALQMWFPGVHSDVGGGYRETGLSDGALTWMIDEASKCGLAFHERMLDQIKPNYLDTLHDSCTGLFSLFPTQPRSAPRLMEGNGVHKSALDRLADPPISQCPYRIEREIGDLASAKFEIFAMQQWNPTGLWLEAGRTYVFEASGEWMDGTVKCGPEGTDDGHFQPGELLQAAGSVWGKVEQAWKKVTGNQAADFRLTKRHEHMPWFSLVGSIANGSGVDKKDRLEPHESFLIGTGCEYTPRKPGYFYAYANDAWNCYSNNRGKVELTVTRR
ncbi:MAG TPA: DUF2235 domain-containing protein [Gammaproteobacteria bacterium]|nr:DUF2235 domain-containing protein [Gammaproteobacteria bacterium]